MEHFFNARGSGLEKTFLGLLRSLIYQLLSEVPEFYNAFVRIYRKKDMIQGQWEWRQNELNTFLRSRLKSSELKLIILVDALDECSLDEIALVVSFLENLSLDAVEAGTHLRICLSSRPYPSVSMKKNSEFTLDDNAEHDKDIKKYVQAKSKTKDPKIGKRILQKANGVFLWVVLVVEILNKAVDRGHPEEMQKMLDDIPSDLDNFFERVIFNDPEKNPETLLMFQLVLFGKEELTPEELVFAVMARFHEGYLKPRSQSEMTDDLLRARIVDSSKGLIEVSSTIIRVQFIHQTVTDFFLRNRRLARLYPTLEPDAIAASHDQLRACCLDYFEKCPIDSQTHNGQSAEKLRKEYPFLEYSTIHLLDHAEAALQGYQMGIENDRWPRSPDPWFQTWKRIMFAIGKTEYLHGDLNVGLVYILILHNCHNLLAVVLRCSDVDVNIQGGLCNNALQLAVANEDDVATRILLEFDVSIHLNGGYYFGTVLQAASVQGNHSFVSTILEKGADLNASGGLFGTALQAAAARGNLQILKTLLERGAEVNVYGGIYGSALHAAMENQKVEIFQHLLRAGANVNIYGGIYGSWLKLDNMRDEIFGNFMAMTPSLESPPLALTVTSISLENGPAIVWAARNLEYDQVKLLLENGADVNAASGPWESKVPVMCKILRVRRGSLKYELGMTALIWAARNGKRDMVELLLENGAEIETHSSSGETALLAGSQAGHEGIVRFLIERGSNQSAKDGSGENALYKAAANGHVNVMRLLLNHENFDDTHDWNDAHVIRYTDIETVIVNGGVSLVLPDYHENDDIGNYEMKHSIQCLVMNGGFLYAGPEMKESRVNIEKIQINGGICYFDMMHISQLYIQKLEMNGGSFHLMIRDGAGMSYIDSLELNNGHLSITANGIRLYKVSLFEGSFNCNVNSGFHAPQVTLGSTLSGSSRRENIADPLSISGLPEVYIKHSDGQIEQHGTSHPGDQNREMGTMLSPLYAAAQNGHLEAVQLLLKSGAKFDKAWPIMNPLDIAQRRGHHEIVRLFQEKGQEEKRRRNERKARKRRK